MLVLPRTVVVLLPLLGVQDDPRYGLLTPIPDSGGVPPIVEIATRPTAEELDFRRRGPGSA